MARSSRGTETRIGDDARAAATGRLDAALREGRLDLAEYERRLVVIQASRVRDDLTPAIADLPVHSGQTGPGLRISSVDREQALVRLADAMTDGRIEADAYVDAEELLHRAVTYADLDAVVGDLDARASLAERDQAIARIDAAAAGGLLNPTEQHDRIAAVRGATTDAQLAALVADLATDPGTSSKRASNADREAVAAQLHDAVEAGLLDVTEFDERVRAVYAARLLDELARLVADLPEPATPPAPPAPRAPSAPRLPARPVDVSPERLFRTAKIINRVGLIGSFVGAVAAVAFGVAGFLTVTALIGGAWVLGMVVLVTWGVSALRAIKAAPLDVVSRTRRSRSDGCE